MVEVAERVRPLVLIVEDEVMVRAIMVEALTDAGAEVIEAATGDAAMVVLRSKPVDILFTDVRMPGSIDGLELAKIAARLLPSLKIAVASGYVPGQRDSSPFPFFQKPYNAFAVADSLVAMM